MKTWSIERALVGFSSGAAVAALGIWDKLAAVERVTRPPRMGHDVDAVVADVPETCPRCGAAVESTEFGDFQCSDHCGLIWLRDYCPDGAERLADAEAEIDAWEPDDTPNPYEPGLTDDELVMTRQLIEERFGDQTPTEGWKLPPNPMAGVTAAAWGLGRCPNQGSMCNCTGACIRSSPVETGHDMGARWAAETFPQYTKPSPAASAGVGDSGEAVSGHSPEPPASPRPTSDVLNTAADFLSISASRTELGEQTRGYIRDTLLPELRDRAAAFKAIEE